MQPTDLLQRVTFRATLTSSLSVPQDAVRELAAGRRPQVRTTIGDHSFAARVTVRGGELRLPVGPEDRAATGVAPGDEVEVSLELDPAARAAAVPSDLAAALACDPGALHYFESLPYERQRRLVHAVERAGTRERRRRRIAIAVEQLRVLS